MTTATTPAPSTRRSLALRLVVGFGPVADRLAGHRWFPLWGRLEHRGRRSGRIYSVPLAPRRVSDGFVVALPFGANVEWVRNALASGTATMTWKGRRFPLVGPEILDFNAASFAFPGPMRRIVQTAGIVEFIRFRDTG